jgi:hypothetical protein
VVFEIDQYFVLDFRKSTVEIPAEPLLLKKAECCAAAGTCNLTPHARLCGRNVGKGYRGSVILERTCVLCFFAHCDRTTFVSENL